jgi:hypothetical protein
MADAVRQSRGSSLKSTTEDGTVVALPTDGAVDEEEDELEEKGAGAAGLACAASGRGPHKPVGGAGVERGARRRMSTGAVSVQNVALSAESKAVEGVCPKHSCARCHTLQSGAVIVSVKRCAAGERGGEGGDVGGGLLVLLVLLLGG